MFGKPQRKQDGWVKNDQICVRVGNTLVITMVWLIAIYSNGWTRSSTNKTVSSHHAPHAQAREYHGILF